MITHLEPDILECKVKWALGSITTKKTSGGDGIPVELFQILKDDAVKVLHSICQQIWKTQQWPQDWKRSVFILVPKKGNAIECSKYCTIALISCGSKVMLKILQTTLQQCVSHELPDVQTVFRKDRGIRVTLPTSVGSRKSKRVPEKHLLLPEAGECVGFISYSPSRVDGSGYLPEAGHYVCLQKWPDEVNPHLKSQKQIQQ